MTETNTEKFLPDLARSLAQGVLTFVGVLAIISGSVVLIHGAINGDERPGLIFFGAVVLSGVTLCAGSVFLSGREATTQMPRFQTHSATKGTPRD